MKEGRSYVSKILVFGHQNPDTDTITSAISMAYLQNKLGKEAEAVALGEVGEETQFALDYFKVDAPRVVTEVSTETDQVMLVDHNEFQQSATDIEQVEILAVVDHHRVANFQTANPLYYRAEPVGCTNTIILKMFKENNIEIPTDIAGLMLSAIISDTLLFKSPTGTKEDEAAAKELAEIAGVDMDVYGLDMLKAGTNIDSKSVEDILEDDGKSFPMGDKLVRIGQVNVVDTQDVLKRKEDILTVMREQNLSEGYDLFILLVTDILESTSIAIVEGSPVNAVEVAFGQTLEDDLLNLPGVISRKKQVVPQLTNVLENV